ncbi:MAG: exodeoxyribonuclease VII large subunit [Eggerthellaceae bacterium]
MLGSSNEKQPPLSVSAAMAAAKGALERCTLSVIGEVSEFSNKRGYKAVYFTVKDAGASLPCMMWLNRFDAQHVAVQVGSLVEMTGRFTLYAPKGRMNFDVFSIALAGEGNLRLQVANLAKKLEAEGLMAPARKRALPLLPQTIGLVTSPRGAAVHDVLRTLRRRFPVARIVVAGVPVEGDRAPAALIEALHSVEAAGAEVVLLVRGGGSFEDLMPFNDEALARAIAALSVPVVTGIGHEPDTSIADMVADLRASTPTAAAEAASPARDGLEASLAACAASLSSSTLHLIQSHQHAWERRAQHPLFLDSNRLFATEAQTLDMTEERLHRIIPQSLARDEVKLATLRARMQQALPHTLANDALRLEGEAERLRQTGRSLLPRFDNTLALRASRLHDLSPLTILARGYSVTRAEDGHIMKSVEAVSAGQHIRVNLSDGDLLCAVEQVKRIENALVMLEDAPC